MKRNILFGLLAMLMIAGCSSADKNPSNYGNSTTTTSDEGIATAKVFSRGVAADKDSCTQPIWKEDVVSTLIRPDTRTAQLKLRPQFQRECMVPEIYACEKYGWGVTTCQDIVCNGGQGKSEYWNAYFGAKKEMKAAALDQAIDGISANLASKIVAYDQAHPGESGIFNSKPRSWQEFRERINRAKKLGLINDQQYNEIFNVHGQSNMTKLGYQGQDCHYTNYQCEVWGVFPAQCERLVKQIETVKVGERNVALTIEKTDLLPYETERISVSGNMDPQTIKLVSAPVSMYQVSNTNWEKDTITYSMTLTSTGRIQQRLPEDVLDKKNTELKDTSGDLNLLLVVNPQYIPMDKGIFGEDDKLMVKITAEHCVPGGFFSVGKCKGDDKSNLKAVSKEMVYKLGQAKSSFVIPEIPGGERAWVKYKIFRANSKYYTSEPTSEQTLVLDKKK